VDQDTYDTPQRHLDPAWSRDGRFLAYAKLLSNHFRAIYIYAIETGSIHAITDGMVDAVAPRFDKTGKYLFFLASLNAGPPLSWLEMSSLQTTPKRRAYIAVLSSDGGSPFSPESEEEDSAAAPAPPPASEAAVRCDFEDIGKRIVALPGPARPYIDLFAGAAGKLLLLEDGDAGRNLSSFDLASRTSSTIVEGIGVADVSFDGKKIIYQKASIG
jgi:tricorn protease